MNFQKDTRDKCYFYFTNCFLEITADTIACKNYNELSAFVWRSNVIPADFHIQNSPTPSQFERFLKLAMNKTEDATGETEQLRYNSIRATIGYLLHAYKDPSLTKAVVAVDQKITRTGEPNGRSGKSLMMKGIAKAKKVTLIDGQTFDFNKPFAFQQVNLDTQIINFNDVRKMFEFDRLFGLITEEFTFEKKRMDSVTIPFESSPKFYISTNYTLRTEGDSSRGRMHVIEFSDFFNADNTPLKYFNKRFFDDWDALEYNRFYNFLISCVQYFLKHGLVEFPLQNYNERKLLAFPYGQDLIDYIQDVWKPEVKEEYDQHEKMSDFLKHFPKHDKMTIQSFTKFLRAWAELNDMVMNPHTQNQKDTRYKKNGITYVYFVKLEDANYTPGTEATTPELENYLP